MEGTEKERPAEEDRKNRTKIIARRTRKAVKKIVTRSRKKKDDTTSIIKRDSREKLEIQGKRVPQQHEQHVAA